MNPKLTIIIPCYNCAATLREAVDSCYTQGLLPSEFEIVLCNDASTDDTAQIISHLEKDYANIRTITHPTNRGGGAARNTAARAAAAAIIFCLDSDDLLPPGTMRAMLEYLKKHNLDGVGIHHSTKFRGIDTSDIDRTDTFAHAGEQIPLENLLQKNDQLCSLYSVFMFTKAAFEKCGGYPEHHGFDTQGFAWRFLCAGLCAHVCPESRYLHRIEFHQSYYLREYSDGKLNINWRAVLVEHEHLFTKDTIDFIKTYPVRDFTQSLFFELCRRTEVFLPASDRYYGKSQITTTAPKTSPISRDSFLGVMLRARGRLRKLWHTY
jgi:glycosyltransferase involved in cell wall biosynthesis